MNPQHPAVDWDLVTRIRGVTLDKITYEESFLVIEMGGTFVSAGELDADFERFEQEVRQRFPDIPVHWRGPLEEAVGPYDMILWARAQP